MSDNFDQFIARILSHEGGYSADRNDPGNWTGGKVGSGQMKGTKYGIAANTYPNEDIKGLTLEKAKAIYRRDFWGKIKGDQLPPAVAFQVLDGAINSGVQRSVKWLQVASGASADGIIGPRTLQAANGGSTLAIVLGYNAARLEFMTGLSNWKHHGAGWARRIAANLKHAAGDL